MNAGWQTDDDHHYYYPEHWQFICACCGRRFFRDWTESDKYTGEATPHLCDDCLKADREPETVEEYNKRFVSRVLGLGMGREK